MAGLIVLYRSVDPATNPFPKCPFKKATGYQCPGCGSQRALHHLLNLEIGEAFKLNPLLLLSIPYLIVGLVFENVSINMGWLRIRKILFGPGAIKLILVIVILFWIGRNFVS